MLRQMILLCDTEGIVEDGNIGKCLSFFLIKTSPYPCFGGIVPPSAMNFVSIRVSSTSLPPQSSRISHPPTHPSVGR